MDVFNYIKKDHKRIDDLFEQIIATKSKTEREQLFEILKTELILHAASEQDTFYKALKKSAKGKDEALHAIKEHKEITKTLEDLDELSINHEAWLIKLGELKALVQHHVHEEEHEIFKLAKKRISANQAKQLALEMDERKQEMMEAITE